MKSNLFKNAVAEEVVRIEAQPGDTDFADLQPLVAGVRGRERCIEAGDIDDGIWSVGMVVGLIDDIPTCEELIQNIVNDAKGVLNQRLIGMLQD